MVTYGSNDAGVRWVLDRLRALEPAAWRKLELAHAASATDELFDALAGVLARTGLRAAWFDLRARATELATEAAARYAKVTHEQARSIGHNRSANTWQGEVEVETFELLPPIHEMAFRDAASYAAGVVLMRPYVSDADFSRFWAPYEAVLGQLPS